jgi:hypothetical protein
MAESPARKIEFCCAGLDDDDYGNQVGRGSSGGSIMTYQEALMKAQKGEADHQVLEVFRSAYEEVKRGYDDQLINERKTNLAALLLDIANKEGDAGLACFSLYPCAPGRLHTNLDVSGLMPADLTPRPRLRRCPYHDSDKLRSRHLDGHVPGSRKAVRGGSEGVSQR